MTTPDFRALCAQMLAAWDKGDDIVGAMNRARAALAEGAGVGPADAKVAELVVVLRADAECVSAEQPDLMQITDAQLSRAADLLEQGTTHPRPIPVAERLPGAGDYLDEGWAWYFNPRVGWRQAVPPVSPSFTHWLPAHDLPLPAQEGADG
jgi:hypothetical protein